MALPEKSHTFVDIYYNIFYECKVHKLAKKTLQVKCGRFSILTDELYSGGSIGVVLNMDTGWWRKLLYRLSRRQLKSQKIERDWYRISKDWHILFKSDRMLHKLRIKDYLLNQLFLTFYHYNGIHGRSHCYQIWYLC